MSGLIGKAMRFGRSPQGRSALARAQEMLKSRGQQKPARGRAAGRPRPRRKVR
jgi:hypothetical protein